MEPCPYCIEEIKNQAIKCQHCGSDLITPEKLEDAKAVVEAAKEHGLVLRQFVEAFKSMMTEKGWTNMEDFTPARLETIFRTYILDAYSARRYEQMKCTAEHRPYWLYNAVMDDRTRPEHSTMHNKIFRFDDPIWDVWFPLNDFNCRCSVRALTANEVEARGLQVLDSVQMNLGLPAEGFRNRPGTTPGIYLIASCVYRLDYYIV